ncbi:hypothetical protein QSI_3963 [Clostridioides difficile P28]|nr:hypothetical protein QSI_3963 [Clostridioides difficile P28]
MRVQQAVPELLEQAGAIEKLEKLIKIRTIRKVTHNSHICL